MVFRTDMALEACESADTREGLEIREQTFGTVTVTRVAVKDGRGEKAICKPVGNYVTVRLPPFTDSAVTENEGCRVISRCLSGMLPEDGTVLVAGLGNRDITPDALGPMTADRIPATRHITGELERTAGFTGLRPTAVFSTGVLGQTGIESAELIRSLCGSVRPSAVIVIDALASRTLSNLGRTVQLCDTGIAPGAGVRNNRPRIDKEWLGVPVIAVGVPTVVDADTLAREIISDGDDQSDGADADRRIENSGSKGMIVTPREIDLLIDRASALLALAVNRALHPAIDPIELAGLS